MEVEIAQPCCSVWPAAESVMGIMVMLVSPAAAKLPMVRACPEGAVTVTLRSRFNSSSLMIKYCSGERSLIWWCVAVTTQGTENTQASLAIESTVDVVLLSSEVEL